MKVLTLKGHEYAQLWRMPGEEYDMDEQFVDIMEAHGNVQRVKFTPSNKIQTADMNADKPKGGYRRRDLKAD